MCSSLNPCPDGLGHFFREEFSKIKWAFAWFWGGLNPCQDGLGHLCSENWSSIWYFLLLTMDLRLARILCGTYIPSNGDLTKSLKSARKKVPQSARLNAGGGVQKLKGQCPYACSMNLRGASLTCVTHIFWLLLIINLHVTHVTHVTWVTWVKLLVHACHACHGEFVMEFFKKHFKKPCHRYT